MAAAAAAEHVTIDLLLHTRRRGAARPPGQGRGGWRRPAARSVALRSSRPVSLSQAAAGGGPRIAPDWVELIGEEARAQASGIAPCKGRRKNPATRARPRRAALAPPDTHKVTSRAHQAPPTNVSRMRAHTQRSGGVAAGRIQQYGTERGGRGAGRRLQPPSAAHAGPPRRRRGGGRGE